MNILVDNIAKARQRSRILSEIDFFSLQPMRVGRIRYFGLHSFWFSFLVLFVFSFKEFPQNWLPGLFFAPPLIIAITNQWLVSIRRMHDINLSGWWLLVGIIPYVGLIIAIALLFIPGSAELNKFGAPPQKPKILDYLLISITPLVYFILYLLGIYDLT